MGKLPEKKSEPIFFVDAMLGKIAKKLRLMGYDSLYEPHIIDDDLIKIARREERIIISRDFNLTKKSIGLGIKSIFLEEKNEFDQLLEIIRKLNLEKIVIKGNIARCPICNFKLESIDKNIIENKVPKEVLKNKDEFWICKNCDKIFWEGSHITRLKKLASDLNERKSKNFS